MIQSVSSSPSYNRSFNSLPLDILTLIFRKYFSLNVALTCKRFYAVKVHLLNEGVNRRINEPPRILNRNIRLNPSIQRIALNRNILACFSPRNLDLIDIETGQLKAAKRMDRMVLVVEPFKEGFVSFDSHGITYDDVDLRKEFLAGDKFVFSSIFQDRCLIYCLSLRTIKLINLSDCSVICSIPHSQCAYVHLTSKNWFILRRDRLFGISLFENIQTKKTYLLSYTFFEWIPVGDKMVIFSKELGRAQLYDEEFSRVGEEKSFPKAKPNEICIHFVWRGKWVYINPQAEIYLFELTDSGLSNYKTLRSKPLTIAPSKQSFVEIIFY